MRKNRICGCHKDKGNNAATTTFNFIAYTSLLNIVQFTFLYLEVGKNTLSNEICLKFVGLLSYNL